MIQQMVLVRLTQNLAHLVPDGIEAHRVDGGWQVVLWGDSEISTDRLIANLEEIMILANNILPLEKVVIKGRIEVAFRAAPALKLYGRPCEGLVDRLAKESNRPPAPDRRQE